jgi:hypothetical protein
MPGGENPAGCREIFPDAPSLSGQISLFSTIPQWNEDCIVKK